jgi:hypothetical protein
MRSAARSRASCQRDDGSLRIATIGDKSDARHAGRNDATSATVPTMNAE